MKRYSFVLALAAVLVMGMAGCNVEASLGLGTVILKTKLTVEEWAQTNFLKAVDDLIAKVPDPNKKEGDDGDREEYEGEFIEHEVPGVEDLGSGDGVDGG